MSCKIAIRVEPSLLMDRQLCRSAAALKANGQNIVSIICGHIQIPCKSKVQAERVSILFLFLIIPF